MESNIERLENIMKPYFEKKEEIKNFPSVLQNNKELISKEIQDMKKDRISRRKDLEIELENLRVRTKVTIEDFKKRKEQEIDEYINQALSENPFLSVTYTSLIRNDLDQQYNSKLEKLESDFKQQEEQILSEIKSLKSVSEEEKDSKDNLEKLNNLSDFSRVDLRELVEIKDELRKKLFAERKRLNLELLEAREEQNSYNLIASELKENQLNFTKIMDEISNFKYEYNDQNQVINSDDWRKLYEESNLISANIQNLTKTLSEKNYIIHKLNDINKSLEKVEEYIKITELTKEEISAVMMSMTPWERKEYDRRKANKISPIALEDIPSMIDNYDIEIPKNENVSVESNKGKFEDLFDVVYNQIKEEEKSNENNDFTTPTEDEQSKSDKSTEDDLYNVIYNDIVSEIDSLKSVKMVFDEELENKYRFEMKENGQSEYETIGLADARSDNGEIIELPCGEFVSQTEFIESLDRLYEKNKETGKTYIVEESENEHKNSHNIVRKIKRLLKKVSVLKLIKNKTVQKVDLIRVHGKEKIDNMFKKFNINLSVDKNKTEQIEGNYIEKDQLKYAIKNIITKKGSRWTKKMLEKLKVDTAKNLSDNLIDVEVENNVKTR